LFFYIKSFTKKTPFSQYILFMNIVIINEYEEGGLKRPHIQSFNKALKMSWLHKLLDTFNHSPRKLRLLGDMQKWGGSNILYLNK
jgi:hypothetical protein